MNEAPRTLNSSDSALRDALARRFARIAHPAGVDAPRAFALLDKAYGSSSRHYHGWGHIDDCLGELDRCVALLRDAQAVELAIWFHDLVCEPGGTSNELQSAEIAHGLIAAHSPLLADTVHALIMATDYARATPGRDADSDVLADIDHSSFGKPFRAFWLDVCHLRAEAALAFDPRADDLRRLAYYGRILDGEAVLYRTAAFRERLWLPARRNMRHARRLLARLLRA